MPVFFVFKNQWFIFFGWIYCQVEKNFSQNDNRIETVLS